MKIEEWFWQINIMSLMANGWRERSRDENGCIDVGRAIELWEDWNNGD